jgi:uncharacterized protein
METGPVNAIFVNLVSKDLKKSMAFFQALGFSFNPQFTNDSGACLMLGPNIFAMLLAEPFFQGFTIKPVADPTKSTEVLTAIGVESRQKVDEIVEGALKSGGSPNKPAQDHGWMYSRSFQDPDGHIWEVLFADPTKIPGTPA